MRRRFNTAGDCRPELHYMVPAADRLPDARRLIDEGSYFVVHAPRQTGKTTTLFALAKELTESGKYAALRFSCEMGEVAGDNVEMAADLVLASIRRNAEIRLPPELRPPPFPAANPGDAVNAALRAWAESCPRPLVLFFDEIDALRGQSLISVLRQLRDGFSDKPRGFPQSIVLCGLRDVRDYKAASGGDPNRLGTSSPFNIKVASLTLSNFNKADVELLYRQHTAETGQVFTQEALDKAFDATGGQPWLVNALAREIVDVMEVPATEAITPDHVDEAKERLVLARATHLDSLVARLMEPRVKRILEPILAGTLNDQQDATYDDDLHYCQDLGLVAPKSPLRIANAIYKEVIVRVLGTRVEYHVIAEPRDFVLADGTLDARRILDEFAAFWMEHGDILTRHTTYNEFAPQLVFMAYLQRVVNGGGYIDREYGIGRGRIDLLVRWPYKDAEGKRTVQREAIEMKVWRDKQVDPLKQGLAQLDQYLTKVGLDNGVLIIFDRRKSAKAIEKRTKFKSVKTPSKKKVLLLRA